MTKLSPRSYFLFPALLLPLVAAIVFRDFLFGDRVLLYKDIGSDSLINYYPWFVHFSDYLRQEGFPSWSFSVGMGQDIFYLVGYLVLQPLVWLPKELIAHALVYQHVVKVFIAGLFFYRFLQLRGLQLPALVLGPLLLCFSAYMSMGSCWYPMADEVVCFTALLCATQEALKRGRWALLTLAVALVGFISPLHLYLGALFLSFYVPVKLFVRHGWQVRNVLRMCVVLTGAALLGVALGAVVTVPYTYTTLNSLRGFGLASHIGNLRSFPIFGLESHLHYITAVLRPLANDLVGNAGNFKGWLNYLEAPVTYCGLLPLVLLPQAFLAASPRQRIVYTLFLLGIVLPTVCPWLRYLFWLFQGDYYRAYSLFSILGSITLGTIAFSRYVGGRSLNVWLLAGTIAVLLAVVYAPLPELQSAINPALKQQVTLFLGAYAILLVIGRFLRRQGILGWILVVVATIELVHFNTFTVSGRDTIRKEELSERVGYNDETVDAVRDVKAADKGFFRITKTRFSAPTVWSSLNDAMVFGYYSTASYNSFNNVHYSAFLTAIDAVPENSEAGTRWSIGLLDSPIGSTFACEKYLLISDPLFALTYPQYELNKHYGQDDLLRNSLFLPLGLKFNRFMSGEAFRHLSTDEKPQAMLRAVVLEKETEGKVDGLSELTASALGEEMGTTSLSDLVTTSRSTAFTMTSFRQSRIEGDVHGEGKGILVFQTPYDRGWKATEDGLPAPVLKVDIGLLGVAVDGGNHKLALSYHTPFLSYAAGISLLAALLFAVLAWRWPRLRLPV